MNKAVVAGGADGLFVEPLRVEGATFDASDLGSDQRGAVFEVLWAMFRPHLQLSMMVNQRCQMRLSRSGSTANCGV